MTKTWVVIGTILLFFVLEKEVSFFDLKGNEEAIIIVILYDEPTLKSNAEKHSFTSSKLLVNYEYCNFYSVVVKLSSGVRVNKYLYKKSEEISLLGLKISATSDFKKKDCNSSQNSRQKVIRSINPLYPDVNLQGLEDIRNSYHQVVAPPRREERGDPFYRAKWLGTPQYPVAPPRTQQKPTIIDVNGAYFKGG